MSRIADLVQAEVDRTPQDDDDGEPGAEPGEGELEPGAEPGADEPAEPIDMGKAIQKLENENTRHAKRVAEIMGPDFLELHECPTCSAGPLGFVFELAPAEPEYQPNPDTERCPTCAGLGDVATGAIAERGRLLACPACEGYGYLRKDRQQPPAPLVQLPSSSSPPPPAPGAISTADPWDRPAGHPHWGLPPASVGAV